MGRRAQGRRSEAEERRCRWREARAAGAVRVATPGACDAEAAVAPARLRQKAEYAALRTAFAKGSDRFGFRLCHYAVLNDHLHLICEAADRTALRRGLQGLAIRGARALNRLWRRKGKVFADRYHQRVLTSPREVRNALVYVMGNARHHAAEGRMVRVAQAIDTYTSAPWIDGFRERVTVRDTERIVRPTSPAKTWLLDVGWRRHGLLPTTTTA